MLQSTMDDGDLNHVRVTGNADRAGTQTRLDVRVLAAPAVVLDALVVERGDVTAALGDLDNQVGAGVDHIFAAVVSPAPSREDGGGQEEQGEEQGEKQHGSCCC